MKLRPRYPLQFMVALVAAFLLWYALAAERSENISVRGVRATLILSNNPRDLVVTSSVPDTVLLQLRGRLATLDPRNPPEVLLDLSNARPGINSYPINESDITLPAGVELVSVDPPAITLELERYESRLIPVRPNIEGRPASGFVLGKVTCLPNQLTVQGPASLFQSLEYIDTAPISIEGITGTLEIPVQPRLPNIQLRTLNLGPVVATVEVVPEPTPVPTPASTQPRG